MSIEVEWARMTAPDLREIAAREGALASVPGLTLGTHFDRFEGIERLALESAVRQHLDDLIEAERSRGDGWDAGPQASST